MNTYLDILALAGLLSFVFMLRALYHLRQAGFWAFALVQLGMAWWIACYLGEELSAPGSRMFWFQMKFGGIGLIAPAWMIYTSYHVGRPVTPRWLIAVCFWEWLALIPVIFTNSQHKLLYSEVYWAGEMAARNGPLALIHVLWNYGLLLGATVILFRAAATDPVHRRQLFALMLAGMFPWIGSIANEFLKADPSLRRYIPLNPTLPGFALSNLATGWAILRWRILNPRSIGREHLFDTMADALIILDDRAVVADVNRSASKVLGMRSKRLVGQSAQDVFARWPEVAGRLGTQRPTHAEIWLEMREASRCYDFQIHPLFGNQTQCIGWLLAGRDITDRKALEDRLRFLGNHDSLTGLYNRAFIEEESDRLRRGRHFPVSVIVFDLDSLKAVNDSQGHGAGDELIRSMAQFLVASFRADDLVARMGGDEFWAILPSTDRAMLTAIEKRLDEDLQRYNQERSTPLRFSRGSAVIVDAALWSEGLLEADLQMYTFKKDRKVAEGVGCRDQAEKSTGH